MKKIIKIGEDEFEYKGTMSKNYAYLQNYKMLSDCYNKPSLAKVNIFNEWLYDLNKYTTVKMYGINGRNAHLITINAIVEFKNKLYYLDIHKSRNDIYELL